MEILQILKANDIGLNNMVDLRSNPGGAPTGADVVRRAGARQTAPPPPSSLHAVASSAHRTHHRPAASTARDAARHRFDLRAEYTAKRQQIISDLDAGGV